jgi:hypothetical protein
MPQSPTSSVRPHLEQTDVVVMDRLARNVRVVAGRELEPFDDAELGEQLECPKIVARPILRWRARASSTRSAAVKCPARSAISAATAFLGSVTRWPARSTASRSGAVPPVMTR